MGGGVVAPAISRARWRSGELKEIRACLEAEILTDVQQRLALRREICKTTMVNVSFINRLSHAVELIEKRSQRGQRSGLRRALASRSR